MGWFNRDKVNSIVPYANSGSLRPRVGAKKDTHTVRDDSGNTTQAMTQRRADREETSKVFQKGSFISELEGNPPFKLNKPPVKIGAEYTTYHEPKSSEGKAILKDKKKSAKALKNVNSPKVRAESKAAGMSYDVAKKAETTRTNNNKTFGLGNNEALSEKPVGSEAAYLKGGAKGEQEYRQKKNKGQSY